MTINVYLSGATGYIGGSLLTYLLKSKKFKVSALVRSQEKAEKLKSIGVTPIIGNIDDANTVTTAAYNADIVIEAANCDHLGNAQAIVAGLEKRFKETNKKQIYIHTSGSGILFDPNHPYFGELYPTEYVDTNEEQMASIPVTNPHRNVDTFIIQHSDAYNLVIIAPTLIYGRGIGPEGIANLHSIQIPFVIKAAIKNGYTFQVGEGKNVWSTVHIEDMIDLYALVLDGLLANKITTLGSRGYFFAENGSLEWKTIYQKIAETGFNKGVLKTPKVKSGISDEEIKEGLGTIDGKFFVGSNSICKAEKARTLGWKPKYSEKYTFDYIEQAFDDLTKQYSAKA